jgi:hypothetical protein
VLSDRASLPPRVSSSGAARRCVTRVAAAAAPVVSANLPLPPVAQPLLSVTDMARAKAQERMARAAALLAVPPLPGSHPNPGPLSLHEPYKDDPWTRVPIGSRPASWSNQELIDRLCRQGGPELSSTPPTRSIELRLGTGSFDDHKYLPLTLPIVVLSDYSTQAGVQFTRLTTPFRMGPTKLLGHRIPNGVRLYFDDTDARDTVWGLLCADLASGVTISDFGLVPWLSDCVVPTIVMDGDSVKTYQLSDNAFTFLRPDSYVTDRVGVSRYRDDDRDHDRHLSRERNSNRDRDSDREHQHRNKRPASTPFYRQQRWSVPDHTPYSLLPLYPHCLTTSSPTSTTSPTPVQNRPARSTRGFLPFLVTLWHQFCTLLDS